MTFATIFRFVLGLAFTTSGALKLTGKQSFVDEFASWGLPYWFLILIGVSEAFGGVLFFVPELSAVGALVIAAIMIGAIWTHLANGQALRTLPGLIVLGLCIFVFWSQRADFVELLRIKE